MFLENFSLKPSVKFLMTDENMTGFKQELLTLRTNVASAPGSDDPTIQAEAVKLKDKLNNVQQHLDILLNSSIRSDDTDQDKINVINTLIAAGANVNGNKSLLGSPLLSACSYSTVKIVKTLVEHGAMYNAYDRSMAREFPDAVGLAFRMPALVVACCRQCITNKRVAGNLNKQSTDEKAVNEQLEIVKYLLSIGAEINPALEITERHFYSPLYAACSKSGSPQLVNLLLQNGAKVDAPINKSGYTALHGVIEYIGSNRKLGQREKTLSDAAGCEILNVLLETGCNVDIQLKSTGNLAVSDKTALHMVVEYLNAEPVAMLLKKNPVLLKDKSGYDPMSSLDEKITELRKMRQREIKFNSLRKDHTPDKLADDIHENAEVAYAEIKGLLQNYVLSKEQELKATADTKRSNAEQRVASSVVPVETSRKAGKEAAARDAVSSMLSSYSSTSLGQPLKLDIKSYGSTMPDSVRNTIHGPGKKK